LFKAETMFVRTADESMFPPCRSRVWFSGRALYHHAPCLRDLRVGHGTRATEFLAAAPCGRKTRARALAAQVLLGDRDSGHDFL